MRELAAFLVALLTTLVLLKPVIDLLRRRSVVDVPNARSSHAVVTPRGGGLGVMAGVVAAVLVSQPPSRLLLLTALAVLAAALGLRDDLVTLPALPRLVLQALLASAGVLVILCENPVRSVGVAMAGGFGFVWLVGYVNAFNFMDGINGISAITGAATGGWLWLLAHGEGDALLAVGSAALTGACLGFLPWNAPRAKVFLGDVGSYGLGFLLASLGLWAVVVGTDPLQTAAPFLVYVADTAVTLISRVVRGETWHEAHREHRYQQLCAAGLSHAQAAAVVLVFTILACAVSRYTPPEVGLPLIAALLCGYAASPSLVRGYERG